MALNYTRQGRGEPLVLIHGLGASGRVWDPVLERLSADRDVIVVDLPGFGASPSLPAQSPPTASALARAVAEHLYELGVSRPHVAGNSLGGWVALELGRTQAASVAAISPAGLWRRPLGPRSSDLRRMGRALRWPLAALMRTRRGRAFVLRPSVAHPDRVPPQAARRLVADWLDAPGYDAANHEMRAAVLERPEEIKVPVTIVRGDEDRLVGLPASERTPPGATLITLAGAGHTPTWDAPELIADLLLQASAPANPPVQPPR